MSEAKGDFDWVTARKACSINAVFEKLRIEVGHDVTTRTALRERTEFGFECGFEMIGGGHDFAVILHAPKLHKSVTFALGDKCISVHDEAAKMFDATIGINDEGECMLYVNGQERTSWQVRKMALEGLLFGAY